MTTTHTPGPWQMYPSSEQMQVNVGVPDSAIGHAIAFGNTQAEAQANARLIAAAPDLLAALQYVLDAHDYDGALTMGTARLSPAIRARIEREIAKATGQDVP